MTTMTGLCVAILAGVALAADGRAALAAGSVAPGFEAPSTGGDTVKLTALQGKWVVLYFYPRAFTPGCTIFFNEHAQDHPHAVERPRESFEKERLEHDRELAELHGVELKRMDFIQE